MAQKKLGRLASVLRARRIAAGLTLRQVEQQTGISNAYLSQLENGHTINPSPRLLEKLTEAFGSSYIELMEAAGYKPPVNVDKVTLEVTMLASDLNSKEQSAVAAYIRRLVAKRTGR